MSLQLPPAGAFQVSEALSDLSLQAQSGIIHGFLYPFAPQFEHMKNQKEPLFSGASGKAYHLFLVRVSSSSLPGPRFMLMSRDLVPINYVVLRSQALAADNSHPHISDGRARGPLQERGRCVMAPICAGSTCINAAPEKRRTAEKSS